MTDASVSNEWVHVVHELDSGRNIADKIRRWSDLLYRAVSTR
jgi:hypothetical protein